MADRALVLLSGGQDSTVCLAWALERYARVETLGFHYGQRHAVEMQCRTTVLAELRRLFPHWEMKLGADTVLELDVIRDVSESALTREAEITMGANNLPTTFVPGRNLVFLAFAGAVAYRRGAAHIVAGMCETDYSGYPDCRDDTLKSLQATLNLGMESRLVIETPLMWRDKVATWELAHRLGGEALVELLRRETHSCYQGDRSQLHQWGHGCGSCPACELRRKGYEAWLSG